MSYTPPSPGTFLPAKRNTNPRIEKPDKLSDLNLLNEFAQAEAQDQAYTKNEALIAEWKESLKTTPAEAALLGSKSSYAVLVLGESNSVVGTILFDVQPVGPAVQNLNYLDPVE